MSRDGEAVAVRVEQETKLHVPIHTLSGIVCFGQVGCSPFLMGLCAERGVGLSFLTEHGRFLARVTGAVSGNVLLRKRQYEWMGDPLRAAQIVQSVLTAKLANSRTVLLRGAREKEPGDGADALARAALQLGKRLEDIAPPVKAEEVDSLRGREGDAARVYFSAFDHLITGDKENFYFRGRSRRPPLDNMNTLLSFLYTLVTHDVASALETVGLDPAAGYLHALRPGRPSLALDLVEELRPVLADRLALSLVNRRQVKAAGFRTGESGGVVMEDDTRKEVLVSYQKRKQDELIHPFLEERVPLGLVPFVQATLLARYMRGDLDGYPSFVWR